MRSDETVCNVDKNVHGDLALQAEGDIAAFCTPRRCTIHS